MIYFQMKAGDNLEFFIFGFLLIVILIPILYIVPIGINKKEKLLIAGLSFILAEIGLFANKYLSLWKAILILLLLALIATYFYETRLRPRLEGKGTDERSLKGKHNRLDLPNNESKLVANPDNEEGNQDFGDFNLGQDAIDRLLLAKKQADLNIDPDYVEVLPTNMEMDEQKSLDDNLQIPDQGAFSDNQDRIDDQSGVIEDSYNNTERFPDLDETVHIEDEKEIILEKTETEEELADSEIQLQFVEQQEIEEQEDIIEAPQVIVEQFDTDVILPQMDDVHSEQDEWSHTQDDEVDLEDLLSGQRLDNDNVDVDAELEELEVVSHDGSDDLDSEDMVDLLQHRAALFDELDGEESIIENPDLFVEDEIVDAEIEEIEEIMEEIKPEALVEGIVAEENTEIMEIEEDINGEPLNNDNLEHLLEDMEIIDDYDEIEVVDEIREIHEEVAQVQTEESGIVESIEIIEDISPQFKDDGKEILDIHEYISTSENDGDNVTISNDVGEKSDIQIEPIEQVSHVIETKTQQQMLQTMLDFIKLSKPSLSSNEYEELVSAHMHSELSDHDYFTFAYLLIEHYISQEQNEKLFNLLQSLDSKFSKYPVLKQQINYLIERYC